MKLTGREEDLLSGKSGTQLSKCMEILVAVGDCYGANRMIPVTSVHMAGNYSVMMDEGVEWLESLAAEGLKAAVYTSKNPEMFDFELADELDVPQHYRQIQARIDTALRSLGIVPTYSCHHYLVGNLPRFGDHISWASSGSMVYANSIIGARSNRDGDHVALCAALTGVIPEWGLHLTENRKGQVLVDIGNIDVDGLNPADCQALGWHLGKILGGKIPVFTGLPRDFDIRKIKGLLYSLTVPGSMSLVHLVGITPEAPTVEAAFGTGDYPKEALTVTRDEITAAYRQISSATDEKVDLVIFGCPQCAIEEIEKIASLIGNRKIHPETQLWICTSNWCKTLAERMGLLDMIRAAGGQIVADVGAGDGPYFYLKERGIRTTAINSARGSYYSHNLFGIGTWFGSTEQCIESAISGKWEGLK